jgi:hypothetical protein
MKSTLTLHSEGSDPRNATFKDVELAFDVNDFDSCEKFGRTVLHGIEGLPINKIIYFRWKNDVGSSPKDRYIKPWFFSKILPIMLEKKKCECGGFVLCSCHDKCNNCSPCEVERKAHWAIMNVGRLVRLALPEDNYDDEIENQIRDSIDSGDYRRSSFEKEDDEYEQSTNEGNRTSR